MIELPTILSADTSARAAAWLATFALHSTVLLGAALALARLPRVHESIREAAWKAALLGALATASIATLSPNGRELGVRVAIPDALPAAAAPVAGSIAAPGVSVAHAPATGWTAAQWLVALWAAGAAVSLARLGMGWRRFRRTLRRENVPADHPVHARLEALRERAGVRRRIRLTCSESLRTPVAILRGEICLPRAALASLAPGEQDAVLAHETAHLLRGDPLWLWLASALQAVFFFQPLLRLAARGLRETAEYRCDAWAAERVDALVLARSLVSVAGWSHGRAAPLPVPGVAAGGPSLTRRVERLLRASPPARGRWAAHAAIGVALVASAALLPSVSAAQGQPGGTGWSARFGISSGLAAAIERAARAEGVDPELAFRLVRTESRFDERKLGPGGVGLTQIIVPTARRLRPGVTRDELLQRDTNLHLGLRYLRHMLDRYDGRVQSAVQAYYQGPRQLDRNGATAETRAYAGQVLGPQAGLAAYRGPGFAR